MGSHIALVSSALLLSAFPLAVLKLLALVWLGAVLSLLAFLVIAIVARWVILPCADPDLHRLMARSQPPYQPVRPVGKNYRRHR